ncbi:MAG: O-antigen ligase family protein [Blastocatellia bacterium]|nr:O-antigen ligase family protein [Blastocatellia bacterium]
MKRWNRTTEKAKTQSSMLFKRRTTSEGMAFLRQPGALQVEESRGKFPVAYGGVFLIMLLIFVRPQEVVPAVFGVVPLLKIVAAGTIISYILAKHSAGEKLVRWTLELKMMMVMGGMGLLLTPLAASPGDSIEVLVDTFVTLLIIFILMTNLIDTRPRLRQFLFAMVISEFLYAASAAKTFLSRTGQEVERIKGWGTQLENPNDLACVLDLMLPLAVFVLLTRKGWVRAFALVCVVVTAFSVLFTFSRSGFLGLVLALGTIVWKVGRAYRLRIVVGAAVMSVVIFAALPGAYRTRISTIFNPETDQTNSAQERQQLMKVAADLAVKRSVVGIGMGNFHIYSFHEKVAHNSFLETSAELGVIGLIAYLVLIFGPILFLRKIENETVEGGLRPDREIHIMSICFQASLAAYLIYGFFGSVQYFPYLYFSVAYAVALRRIYRAEAGGVPAEATGLTVAPQPASSSRGALWKSYRLSDTN